MAVLLYWQTADGQLLMEVLFTEARRQRHEARQQALIANQPKGLPPHVLNHLSSFTLTNTDGTSPMILIAQFVRKTFAKRRSPHCHVDTYSTRGVSGLGSREKLHAQRELCKHVHC